jgi:hypothetical protein
LLARAGVPTDGLAARLNANETVSLSTRDDEAPLPLGTRFWQEQFDPTPPPADLVWAILSNIEMASLYYGLLAVDGETLRAISADARMQSQLVRHALAVPSVGPALRVRDGRIVPPGGPEAAPLWEALVGTRLDRPAEFVDKLLGADQGRLAFFYRTAAVLPPPRAAWLMSTGMPEQKRGASLRATYAAFAAALGSWQPSGIVPPQAPSPADVIFDVTIAAHGAPSGPAWPDFWRHAFERDDWPGDPARVASRIDSSRTLVPAELLQLLCPQRCDAERIATYGLLQREFPEAALEMLPSLLVVARTRLRYPSLALAIERMRLEDASVYGGLGALARRIEDLEQPARDLTVVQLQSAVALLERWRQIGAPPGAVGDGARTLAALPLTNDGFEGGIVRWLGQLFAPAADETLDSVVLRRLAGSGWQSPGAPFEWEGVAYRVDVATSEEQRIRAVRDSFSSNALDTAAALVRLADGTAEAVAANRAADLAAGLIQVADGIRNVTTWWTGSSTTFDGLAEAIRESADMLRGVKATDRNRIGRAALSARRVADVIAADALSTLVYALAVQDPEGPYTMSREYPRRHHLHPETIGGQNVSPWVLPEERMPDRGTRHIVGALLGLDAGVPQLAQRRLTAGRPEEEPNISPILSRAMQRAASLAKPWTVDAADLAAIEQAHARGAEVVAQWTDAAVLERSLAPAGIAGVRAGWLRWLVARGRPAAPLITLEETVRLGGFTPGAPSSWGVAPAPVNCFCLRLPELSWEMRGEPRTPDSVLIVEPLMRVAIEVQRRKLPAAIAPGVLSLLMTDVTERTALPHHLGVPAIGRAVRRIPAQRFDDYVAAVAARGPLVRVEGSSGSDK